MSFFVSNIGEMLPVEKIIGIRAVHDKNIDEKRKIGLKFAVFMENNRLIETPSILVSKKTLYKKQEKIVKIFQKHFVINNE